MSLANFDHLKQAALTPAHAWPEIPQQARYRLQPEDFLVEEQLGFEPEGQGEHLFLWVEKRGCNTAWVAEQLARQLQVKPLAVGFSGLKDRHAVTRQWFSVQRPGQPLPTQLPSGEGWQTLRAALHPRKLKRGVHKANRFCLRLWLDQDSGVPIDQVQQRWQSLVQQGFPNYFGPQRFGHEGRNLDFAWAIWMNRSQAVPKKRALRSQYLSALRSALFNAWLSEAVNNDTWHAGLPGDRFFLDQTHSQFASTVEEFAQLQPRLASGDIHPAGPLVGKGRLTCDGPAKARDLAFFQTWEAVIQVLCDQGLALDHRPTRLPVLAPRWDWQAPWLQLDFCLPRGGFATSLLRELLQAEDAQRLSLAQNCARVPDISETCSESTR